MKKKILLFGSQGMLGMQFLYDFEEEFEIFPFTRFHLDLEQTEKIVPEILKWEPDVVINCASWTEVELAENPRFQAVVRQINITAPREMAKACKQLEIPFFHISTDFVFGGENPNESFEEWAPKNPLNFYGKSKADGEDAILKEWEGAYIIRTAWLYGSNGQNFVTKILQMGKARKEMRIVNDQFGNPTWTKEVTETIAMLIRDQGKEFPPGIYHAVSEVGSIPPSWYDFASEIARIKKFSSPIVPISSEELSSEVQRPISSVLINTKLPKPSEWKEMLQKYLPPKK